MLINELPDDCLLTIFDCIRDLEDLMNCFKVCEKWCNLVADRTIKAKYFIYKPQHSPDYVCHHLKQPPIDLTCLSKLFPNLRILDLSYAFYSRKPEVDISKLFRDFESLKGIICNQYLDFKLNTNLEMLSIGYIGSNISGINETVKQLHLWNFTLGEFKEVAHYFPNLERLCVNQTFTFSNTTDFFSDGPVMENLKIVELAGSSRDRDYHACCSSFLFMDSCPALQSAHLKIYCCRIFINNSVKNPNLQDLVIQFCNSAKRYKLPRAMSKYPNLKHLAIRGTFFKDEDIKQLILILPKLTLLDVRKSYGVTQKAADHVQDYCKQHGRSIKFYFKKDDKQIESDWPQLLNRAEKICRGFDFMEHCFFKDFDHLPHLLDPIDG